MTRARRRGLAATTHDFRPSPIIHRQTPPVHDRRVLLRDAAVRKPRLDGRTPWATPESGRRAGYHGAALHAAVDTLGQLLVVHVISADEQNRAQQVEGLAAAVQEATGEAVVRAEVDGGYLQPAVSQCFQQGVGASKLPSRRDVWDQEMHTEVEEAQ